MFQNPRGSIYSLLESAGKDCPNTPALLAPGRKPITYGRLWEHVHQVHSALRRLGVSPNAPVAAALPDGSEMASCFLAVSTATAFAPLNPNYRGSEFEFYLSDLNPGLLIVQQGAGSPAIEIAHTRGIPVVELAPRLEAEAGLFSLEGLPAATAPDFQRSNPADTALILHTSGTTSRPKMVPLTHANLCFSAENIAKSLALTPDDLCLNIMPLFHIHGLVGALLSSLTARSGVVCTPGFHALRFFEWFDEFRPTWYTAVPTMHQSIVARAAQNQQSICRSRLRFIRSASSPLPPQLMTEVEAAFQVPLIEAYGMTEASHQIACNPLPPGIHKPLSVGLPTGCEIAIMDENDSILPAGEIGHVVIRGANVTGGYRNNPEANQSSFWDGWFRTGDQGKIDGDGYVFLTGRTKEIINRGGEKISPREVDEVLMDHPAVTLALAFAVPDSKLGEDVGAAIVLKDGFEITAHDLREFVASRLADFKVPRHIVFVNEIPKGPTGKPQRIGLAKQLGVTEGEAAGKSKRPHVPPRTDTEKRLTDLWKDVLRVETAGADDDFFEAGGDSILGMQLCSRIRAAFSVELSFSELFEARSLKSIAAWLDSHGSERSTPRLSAIQKLARGADAPLSYAQRQFWFLDRFEDGGANFVLPRAFRLHGPLDLEALRHSLNQIVIRHEILRTTFEERDGVPVQIVRPPRTLELPVSDISALPEPGRLVRAQELARQEAWKPIDLSADLMLRASLLRLAPDEHILILTTHHIASDGWSSGLMRRELAELYTAHQEHRSPVLPELTIQYADFAVFQNQSFDRGLFEGQIDYWKKQLAGAPELLHLPADRPRPDRQTYRGGVEYAVLPPRLLGTLKELALTQGTTLYMVLLAAFQTLLHRYSGEQDLVVGSPVAARTDPQTESLVGLFSNVLAVRADLRGDPSFAEFLGRTRETTLGALANQDVPTERLIEQLSIRRSARHPALFQVLFQLRNLAAESVTLGAVTLEPFDFDTGAGQFDLYLELRERSEGLHCALNYNSDLYDGATARRILSHYQALLASLTEAIDKPISKLEILPEDERRQVLIEWNETAVDYSRDAPMHVLIRARAQSTPDAVAVVFRNEQLSYRELDRRANGWAHYLRTHGVKPGTLVGISVERSPDLAIAVLAVLKAGGAYVPLDPQYPKQRLQSMLEDARCPVVVTTSAQARALSIEGAEIVCIDQSRRYDVIPTDDPPEVDVQPDDCAYVIFTSGSTGKPNGVLTEHRSLVNNSQFFAKHIGLTGSDRVLQFNSLNFDTAAEEIFPCWLAGAALVFWPEPKAPSIEEFVEFVDHHRITLVDLPTAYWHEWASEIGPGNLPIPAGLRTVVIGGEKAIAAKLTAWNKSVQGRIRLCNTYGPTEATITSTAYDAPADLFVAEPIPIGRPISNATLYILDRNLQPVPIGIPGELYIGGAGIARGYLNRPELTALRFIANPFRETPDPRLYKTGDRARYVQDGTVEFLGRTDNQVKWRGFRIELGEIEEALAHHPRVRAAACSLLEERGDQPKLVAYVVPESGASLVPDELRKFLKERVPDYMLPSQYILLENLPLTPNGKVDRNALPQPDPFRLSAEPGFVPPRTDLEGQIASIWKDVLGVDGIGVHDNFFDLGGHSLKVMQVLSRLHKSINVDVPLRRVFEGPTVAEIGVAVLEILAEEFEGGELSQILDEIETPRILQQ